MEWSGYETFWTALLGRRVLRRESEAQAQKAEAAPLTVIRAGTLIDGQARRRGRIIDFRARTTD